MLFLPDGRMTIRRCGRLLSFDPLTAGIVAPIHHPHNFRQPTLEDGPHWNLELHAANFRLANAHDVSSSLFRCRERMPAATFAPAG